MSHPKLPRIVSRFQALRRRASPISQQNVALDDSQERIRSLETVLASIRIQRDQARGQRDEARGQRDIARAQRDEARSQRDAARSTLERTRNPINFSYQTLDRYVETGGREGELPPQVDLDSPFGRSLMAGRYIRPTFVVHDAYEPPPPGVVFAAVCNDKYVPGLEALLLSLRRVYPQFASRFVVFHDESLSPFSRDRLQDLYAPIEFHEARPDSYQVSLGDAYNHRRVGLLGYLSLEALLIEDADRLILLDSDLLVLGDISPLWHGDAVNAVVDIGIRPFGVVSPATGRPVINSGVLSLPRSELGPRAASRARETLGTLDECSCEILNLYADQKFWNLHLSTTPINYLPNTFNANKALVELYFPEELHNVSILHLTGAKPWYQFANESLLVEEDRVGYRRARSTYARTFTLWNSIYRRQLTRARLSAYRMTMSEQLDKLEASEQARPCVLIGNGPSLAATDLGVFDGFVKVGFNWFVRHADFDSVALDHLVLSSHMFFGGWHTPRPAFPAGFMDALLSHEHRPTIWISFYFHDFIESSGLLEGYEVRYLLYEKPLKVRADQLGHARLNLRSFLLDAHTGVLTAGVPLAVHLGCRAIVLVGCDSNYSQQSSGDYFYAPSEHTSLTTNPATLTKTWLPGGPGPYCYQLTHEALSDLGIPFFDATVGGALDAVSKLPLSEVPSLLDRSDPQAGGDARE